MLESSLLINIVIILFAACCHAMLQLGLGCVVLLYHHGKTQKKVPRRTHTLVSSFIAGVGVMSLLVLAAIGFILSNTFDLHRAPEFYIAVAVAIFVVAILMWCAYYRRKNTTELWLPRPVAQFIDERARVTNNTSEGFLLGAFSTFGELIFLLPIMMVAAAALLGLPAGWELVALAGYVIVSVLPLLFVRCCTYKMTTIGEIQTIRVRHQRFIKAISGMMFVIFAVFIIVFKILEAI
jgi:membrane protein implicated in regulation of membrane protease activity